jgi:hypothetical protein
MAWFLMGRIFSYACYLPMYTFAPLVVVSTTYEESRSIYECFYTVGDFDKSYFYPAWIAG